MFGRKAKEIRVLNNKILIMESNHKIERNTLYDDIEKLMKDLHNSLAEGGEDRRNFEKTSSDFEKQITALTADLNKQKNARNQLIRKLGPIVDQYKLQSGYTKIFAPKGQGILKGYTAPEK